MLSCSIHQSDHARMAMSNVSLEKGMWLALAPAKWTCFCKPCGESARAMRKASWSGSNPTVKDEAAAYLKVSRPSPHPTSSTRLSLKSTSACRVFCSNPSGSRCRVIYFAVLLMERLMSSLRTFASTFFKVLIYRHPLPVVCFPSFSRRSA